MWLFELLCLRENPRINLEAQSWSRAEAFMKEKMATVTSNLFAALATQGKEKKKQKPKKVVNNDRKPNQAPPEAKKNGEQQTKRKKSSKNKASDGKNQEQYREWAQKDKTAVEQMYEKDLQQALLLSKLSVGEEVVTRAQDTKSDDVMPDHSVAVPDILVDTATTPASELKPKSKKKMTLSEFQRGDEESDKPSITSEPAKIVPPVKSESKAVAENGGEIFDVVQGAKDIIHREKKREENKKQQKVQSALQIKYKEQMAQKNAAVSKLQQELDLAQDELKEVKKRNKQLCFILGQGEMKEKSELLDELESLNQAKDELTGQLCDLSQELEKERSKNHSLQADLLKAKSAK